MAILRRSGRLGNRAGSRHLNLFNAVPGAGERVRREKRTEAFVETEIEVEFRGRTRRLAPVWCGECGAQVDMVPPDVAAIAAGVSARAVFGWVEAGRVHFTETAEGALLVCLKSLPDASDLVEGSMVALDVQSDGDS
jgi:hypothetical protein